jgi:hypothetical protein
MRHQAFNLPMCCSKSKKCNIHLKIEVETIILFQLFTINLAVSEVNVVCLNLRQSMSLKVSIQKYLSVFQYCDNVLRPSVYFR